MCMCACVCVCVCVSLPCPGVPERNHRYKEYKATVSMLVNTIDSGYRIGNLGMCVCVCVCLCVCVCVCVRSYTSTFYSL